MSAGGKPAAQNQNETVEDYLSKIAVAEETSELTEARRRAFVDELSSGTFLLMQGDCSRLPPATATGIQFPIPITRPYPERSHWTDGQVNFYRLNLCKNRYKI